MPEANEQSKEKTALFIKEYGELVEKHKCDFVAYPVLMPDGEGAFKLVVQQSAVDTSQMPQKSFIQP